MRNGIPAVAREESPLKLSPERKHTDLLYLKDVLDKEGAYRENKQLKIGTSPPRRPISRIKTLWDITVILLYLSLIITPICFAIARIANGDEHLKIPSIHGLKMGLIAVTAIYFWMRDMTKSERLSEMEERLRMIEIDVEIINSLGEQP